MSRHDDADGAARDHPLTPTFGLSFSRTTQPTEATAGNAEKTGRKRLSAPGDASGSGLNRPMAPANRQEPFAATFDVE